MSQTLSPGLSYTKTFLVPENKTVPYLFPEAPEFQAMPKVLATGFMVGLIEWTCIEAVAPYIDWPAEQTVGVNINVTPQAPTPPGMTVTVQVHLDKVEGRKLTFGITAHDDRDAIAQGTHERFIIDFERFNAKVLEKAKNIRAGGS